MLELINTFVIMFVLCWVTSRFIKFMSVKPQGKTQKSKKHDFLLKDKSA